MTPDTKKLVEDALESFAIMANEDTAYLPDEHVISLTYDDTALDADLGGPNTLLGERFMRAFRKAREALAALQTAVREPEISSAAARALAYIEEHAPRCYDTTEGAARRTAFEEVRAILNLAPVGGRGEPDEVTEDALLNRAKAMVLSKGWRPSDKLSGHSVAQLMLAFGLDLMRKPETARCGYPECGCDFDAVCDAALPPSSQEQGGMK